MTLSNRVICCYIMVNIKYLFLFDGDSCFNHLIFCIRSKFFRVNVSNHEELRDGSSLSYFNIIYQPKSRRYLQKWLIYIRISIVPRLYL